jgi:hypothetical protein
VQCIVLCIVLCIEQSIVQCIEQCILLCILQYYLCQWMYSAVPVPLDGPYLLPPIATPSLPPRPSP